MSTREAVVAARSQVRLAAQQLRSALDGQPERERAFLQVWVRELTVIEAEMERYLARRAN